MNKQEEIKKWIREQGDFSSKPDTATFYSRQFYTTVKEGEVVRRNWYRDELQKTDPDRATTIQRTNGGKELDAKIAEAIKKGELKKEQTQSLWAEASEKFANQAEGKVRAFTENAKDKDVFIKNELPALLKNEKVTEINGQTRHELKEKYDKALEANKHLGQEKAQEAAAKSLNSELSPAGKTFWDNSRPQNKLQEVGYERAKPQRHPPEQEKQKLIDKEFSRPSISQQPAQQQTQNQTQSQAH